MSELIEYQGAGLTLDPETTYEQWYEAGNALKGMTQNLQWWWGDFLNFGEKKYGEKYEQAVNDFGMNYDTCRMYANIANSFKRELRNSNLTWNHHKAVASVPNVKERQSLLKKAEKEKLSVSELRNIVRKKKIEKAKEENPLPDGKYQVIYSDPPWFYNDARLGTVDGGGAIAHYPTMKTDEICELPIPELRASECALFLWATAPCLPDAIAVMKAWGFNYKAQFVWDKVRGFNGHYNDVCHELLLIGTHGSCVPELETLRKSVVTVERTQHSRKPDVFYEIIEEMYEGPYLEMFARRSRGGDWTAWGNEIERVRA